MSKVVKIIVGAALVVAGAVTGNFQLIMMGVSMVGGALLQPKMGNKKRAASSAQVQIGEVPREAIVGTAATAGSLVDAFNYGGKYGTDWEVLVIALADHRCAGLEGFYVNDVYVPFGGDGNVAGYNNQLQVFWRSGTEAQTVPAILTSYGPGWTANDNGAGVAYVVVAYKADDAEAKNPIWPGGRPRFMWVVKGAFCYDARKDTTVGGSGSHRIDVPATWEYSDNPIVTRYKWVRGFYACDRVGQPAQLLVGRGLSAIEAPPQNVFARANLCDEVVGGEKRYRVGGSISAAETFIEVEEDFAAACAGTIVQPEGCVEIDPGEGRAVVATFTDRDLVVGSRVRWNNRILSTSSDEWVNTVVASYIEPTQKWAEHAAPVARDPADIAADGMPRELRLLLGFVTWTKQAQRCAEIVRRMGRLPGRAEVTLPPRFCEIEEGDWVQWQSARHFGGATLTFRVEGWGSNEKWHHTLQLRQISASVYSDTAPLDDGSIAAPSPTPPTIGAPAPGAWSVVGGQLDAGGVAMPALIVTGATDDTQARFIRMEYVQADAMPGPGTNWTDAGVTGPDVTRREFSAAAGGTYYVAVSYIVDGVQGDRRILGPVTAGALTLPDGTPIEDREPTDRSPAPPVELPRGTIWFDAGGHPYRFGSRTWIGSDGSPWTGGDGTSWLGGGYEDVQDQIGPEASRAALLAQNAADDARGEADLANIRLGEIASDDILTPGEKPGLILDVTTINNESGGIVTQATAFGITTEKAGYEAALSALNGHLATLTAPTAWNALGGNTAIVGVTFRAAFNALFSARQTLLNKIAEVAKSRGDLGVTLANAAGEAVIAAQADATAALNKVAAIVADGVLDKSEKPDVVLRYNSALSEQPGIQNNAVYYAITTEKTTYDAAVAALTAYLTGLAPAYNDYTTDTAIDRGAFNVAFKNFYDKRQLLLDKIAVEAGRSGATMVLAPTRFIACDYLGVPKSSAGFVLSNLRKRGNARVDALSNWTATIPTVVTGTIDTTSANNDRGDITVTAVASGWDTAEIVVTSSNDGIDLTGKITLACVRDAPPPPPPPSGTGATSAQSSEGQSNSTSSYLSGGVVIGPVRCGSSGNIKLEALLTFSRLEDGTNDAYGKWGYATSGSGPFTDTPGGEVMSSSACYRGDTGGFEPVPVSEDGVLQVIETVGGLTAGSDYWFEFRPRKGTTYGGSAAAANFFSGLKKATQL